MSDVSMPLTFLPGDRGEIDRRAFVKLVSATLLAASTASCAGPSGEIVPYVTPPPELVPGVPLHFATAMEVDGYATGVLAESREGRPVKVEGNPDHPASLGASGAYAQASVFQLYDPDRARAITRQGVHAAWAEIAGAFGLGEVQSVAGSAGDGLYFLLEPTASPTALDLLDRIRRRFPSAHVHFYAPLSTTWAADGGRIAFGRPAVPLLDLQKARVIAAFDADLLSSGPFSLRYARQFADNRRVRRAGDPMNRLYVAEGAFTPTGIAADHRLAVRPGGIVGLLAAVLREVVEVSPDGAPAPLTHLDRLAQSSDARWAGALARDLLANRGRAVVAVGDRQPPLAHALACAINEVIGANGQTVAYLDPLLPQDPASRLMPLVDALRGHAVRTLVILGGNPSYNAPADADLPALIRQVPLTLYSGVYESETSRDVQWTVPAAHYLESWEDARALDGTTSIVQPLLAPLCGGRSRVDLLALFAGDERPSRAIVQDGWQDASRLGTDPAAWRESLRAGVIAGTALTPISPRLSWNSIDAAAGAAPVPPSVPFELSLVPDPSVYDGRFANSAWLQELPDPVTKVTWDNAAMMSAATAARIGVAASQAVDVQAGARTIRPNTFITPGVADGLIVVPLGYGRSGGESVARGIGTDAYAALTLDGGFFTPVSARQALSLGLPLVHEFAVTAAHWTLEGRPVVLESDLADFNKNPGFTEEHRRKRPALYGTRPDGGRQWAMAIDLNVCTGCSACMVACQAENNVPAVGKLMVQQSREMHWLRIDRYLSDLGAGTRLNVQPMLCQHCEDAPCEYVCPVNATVHSADGLNEMVYNRCVGTRFCSNNCPYKVRRFNWFNYTSQMPETERMAMNPDVTVRDRGVMEKCTFCVQRIRRADIDAGLAGSDEPYSHLQTACQQACPTRAIVFGSISDPNAAVTADADAAQRYNVLDELGTRPRISYLARLRNANPAVPEDQT
jgi:molybdopterin-containing oxidoreductase family iron-sulfur binding subunit